VVIVSPTYLELIQFTVPQIQGDTILNYQVFAFVNTVFFILRLGVVIGLMFVVISKWKRFPQPSLLAFLAFSLHLLSMLSSAALSGFGSQFALRGGQNSMYIVYTAQQVIGFAGLLSNVLLVIAVYVARSASAVDPGDKIIY
jgi:hypothetical protein